jgi:hypothetical protein
VTDGQSVYALFATGDLAAIDRDGTLLWYRSIVGDSAPDVPFHAMTSGASPVAQDCSESMMPHL